MKKGKLSLGMNTCLVTSILLLLIAPSFLYSLAIVHQETMISAFDYQASMLIEKPSELYSPIFNEETGISTYMTGTWSNVYWSTIMGLGDTSTVEGCKQIIKETFLPLNHRFFIIQNGPWSAETPYSSVTDGFETQLTENWLTACDELGCVNFFCLQRDAIFGRDRVPWDEDVYTWKPYLQNYVASGDPIDVDPNSFWNWLWRSKNSENDYAINATQAQMVTDWENAHGGQTYRDYYGMYSFVPMGTILDHPEILEQYKADWTKMYELYGHHPSWVGFWGSVPCRNRAFYAIFMQYSNYTMNHFASMSNPEFTLYEKENLGLDPNNQHLHKDGTPCKLYQHFVSGEKQYSTYDLACDIRDYHNAEMLYPPKGSGWGYWVLYQLIKLLTDFNNWFEDYANKKWLWWFDVFPYDVLTEIPDLASRMVLQLTGNIGPLPPDGTPTEVDPNFFYSDAQLKIRRILYYRGMGGTPYSSWGHPQDNSGAITPEEIRQYYLYTMPLIAQPLNQYDWSLSENEYTTSFLDPEKQIYMKQFGDLLQRMRYYGGWYGCENGPKVLAFGYDNVGMSGQFFTPALDLTWAFPSSKYKGMDDDNYTRYGDFSQFDAIFVFEGDVPSVCQDRILSFIQNGGGFVSDSLPSWLPVTLTSNDVNLIMEPFTDLSQYDEVIQTGTYGNGRVVIVPHDTLYTLGGATEKVEGGYNRDSQVVLLTNAVLYAAKGESLIPAFYFEKTFKKNHGWNEKTVWSLSGTNNKLLLWLSNAGENNSDFKITLNPDFYGIGNEWIAVDLAGLTSVKGSGNITISETIPAGAWVPMYITTLPNDRREIYCNSYITGKDIQPQSSSFTIKAPSENTVWLVVNSADKPLSVSLDTVTIQEVSKDTINNYTCTDAWMYDSENSVLFIKYTAHSENTVIMSYSTEVLPTYHILSVDSEPSGITFTLNGVNQTSPFNGSLLEDDYTIVMPSTIQVDGADYTFDRWNDNSTNPTKTIQLVSDTQLEAYFTAETSPPPPGKGKVKIFVFLDDKPISADATIVETGENYTVSTDGLILDLEPGTYTIRVTYSGYAKEKTVDISEGAVVRLDYTFYTKEIPWVPGLASILIAIVVVVCGCFLIRRRFAKKNTTYS